MKYKYAKYPKKTKTYGNRIFKNLLFFVFKNLKIVNTNIAKAESVNVGKVNNESAKKMMKYYIFFQSNNICLQK